MENSVERYIENIKYVVEKDYLREAVKMCKRKNNKKRDFLFVNRHLGKHIPERPSKVFEMFNDLLMEMEKRIDKSERVLVIGFAETATAIGEYIGNNLENCIYYMQTTREDLGSKPLVSFNETHSHAVSQRLYSSAGFPRGVDRVVFVEDEITTGATILNFIEEFEKLGKDVKYGVASFLNWQSESSRKTYEALGIERYFLVSGGIVDEKAVVGVKDEIEEKENIEYGKAETTRILGSYRNVRNGCEPNKSVVMAEITSEYIEGFVEEDDRIAVIGTEEFMLFPIAVARELEKRGVDVKTHSTTRSPIVASGEKEYIINGVRRLASAYEDGRCTYIYNTDNEDYDKVFVLTDTDPCERFKEDIGSVFQGRAKIIQIGKRV